MNDDPTLCDLLLAYIGKAPGLKEMFAELEARGRAKAALNDDPTLLDLLLAYIGKAPELEEAFAELTPKQAEALDRIATSGHRFYRRDRGRLH